MDKKKIDKEKIEQFVSLGIPKLLAAAYAKAIGGVTVMHLTHFNDKNGKLTYEPVPEESLSEALLYIQEYGNNVIEATTPRSYNPESGEMPPKIMFVQQEPDMRAFELLLAHSIGRPVESIKVEQETKVLHVIAEEAMKRKDKPNQLGAAISSPFNVWKRDISPAKETEQNERE